MSARNHSFPGSAFPLISSSSGSRSGCPVAFRKASLRVQQAKKPGTRRRSGNASSPVRSAKREESLGQRCGVDVAADFFDTDA